MKRIAFILYFIMAFAAVANCAILTDTKIHGTLNVTGRATLETTLTSKFNTMITVSGFTGAAIQSAINAVTAEGGGIVFLPVGTYTVTTPIVVNSPYVEILGCGVKTVLDATGIGAHTVISETSPECSVVDMYIIGSAVPGGSSSNALVGVSISGTGSKVTGCMMENISVSGIQFSADNAEVRGNVIKNCGFIGIILVVAQ